MKKINLEAYEDQKAEPKAKCHSGPTLMIGGYLFKLSPQRNCFWCHSKDVDLDPNSSDDKFAVLLCNPCGRSSYSAWQP